MFLTFIPFSSSNFRILVWNLFTRAELKTVILCQMEWFPAYGLLLLPEPVTVSDISTTISKTNCIITYNDLRNSNKVVTLSLSSMVPRDHCLINKVGDMAVG